MTREEIVAEATRRHDATDCRCDRRYILSCPRMASAVLEMGTEVLREARNG
jgi:hypothetical protein